MTSNLKGAVLWDVDARGVATVTLNRPEVNNAYDGAMIIPQLADAIGIRQLRRYALTGERFGPQEAMRIGLAHMLVSLSDLEAEGARIVEYLLANGPQAVAQTKAWILNSAWADLDER